MVDGEDKGKSRKPEEDEAEWDESQYIHEIKE